MVAIELNNEFQRKWTLNVRLPLICYSGSQVGVLVPLTHDQLSDDFCSKYCEWRNHNADMFMTKFKNSPDKVKNWFQEHVLTDNRRQVFLIKDLFGVIIGVCGFCDLNEDKVELDTMMRGKSVGHPEIMVLAQRALIWWIFRNFQVDKIVGKVLAHNFFVRHFHKQFGFHEHRKIPLTLKKKSDQSEYVVSQKSEKNDEDLIEIILARSNYKSDVYPFIWPEISK